MIPRQKIWQIADSSELPLIDRLLKIRGISQAEKEHFLHPDLDYLSSPLLFRDIHKGIERIKKAIENKERIVVFGDYDVDGVSGSAILVRTLLKLKAYVSYRLPHRVHDGYGLKNYFIDDIVEKGATVLITVDNGISAYQEVSYAQEKGIDVIITDHHSIPENIPPAFAIFHPKLESETYPFKDLSGSGVAFMFARGLLEAFLGEEGLLFWLQMIDLASLGTVADCVPLIGENRIIVHYGLKQLSQTTHVGLQHLMNMAQVNLSEIDSHTIGFLIGPRLNAAGRMDTALDSLHLFLYPEEKSRQIAEKLHALNVKRQHETEKIVAEAEKKLEEEGVQSIIVIEGEWHLGIIGIVAARLAEKHHVPAFVLGRKDNEYVASCRNEGHTNIIALVREFKAYFTHFGGHEGAAGFSIPVARFPEFKSKIIEYCNTANRSGPENIPVLIDAILESHDLTWALYDAVSQLSPFGEGNEQPLFGLRNIRIRDIKKVGKQGQHLKLTVEKDGCLFDCIGFSMFGEFAFLQTGDVVDIAFELEKNEFQGNTKLSLIVRHIQTTSKLEIPAGK